jgi:hypothetical protein
MSGGQVLADEPEINLYVASIFGAMTGKGLVELTTGDRKLTITPTKAREVAGFLLEAAAAAEGDEALMRVIERQGLSRQRGLQLLQAQRQERTIIERRKRQEMREAITLDQEQADLGTGRRHASPSTSPRTTIVSSRLVRSRTDGPGSTSAEARAGADDSATRSRWPTTPIASAGASSRCSTPD